jgi:signal transduction histidine kinase
LAETGHAILLVTPSGQIAGGFGRPLELAVETAQSPTLSTINLPSDGVAEQWRVLWRPVIRHDGVVVGFLAVALSADAIERALANLFAGLLWGVPLALGLAGIAGYILARFAMRPVDRMTQFARSVSVRQLDRRLDDRGPDDELGRLARTLNDMLERLQGSFERERRFVANAAHELRTPLAALKSRIDVLRQRPRDAEA